MGDQQSKETEQDHVTSKQYLGDRIPIHQNQDNQKYRRLDENNLPSNHVFDSGGESDSVSSSSSSGARPKNLSTMSKTNLHRQHRSRFPSDHIKSQSSQMSSFSASVPDMLKTGSQQDVNRTRDITKALKPEGRGGVLYRKEEDVLRYKKSNRVHGDLSCSQKERHLESNDGVQGHKQHLPTSNGKEIAYTDRKHPIYTKKETNYSTTKLLMSQQVFSSHPVENHKEQLVKDLPSKVNIEKAWIQFQHIQHGLQQLQHGSNQILQELDNEERENEEWKCVISKKAAGIESRLQRIEEKTKEEETALIQLSELVKVIRVKFDGLETIVRSIAGGDNSESRGHPEIELVPVEDNPVSSENPDKYFIPKEPRMGSSHDAVAPVSVLSLEDEDVSVLKKSSIDLCSLLNITKDEKGYKQKMTNKKDDNRRSMRREKRTKKSNKNRSDIQLEQSHNATQETSKSNIRKSPSQSSPSVKPTQSRKTTVTLRGDSTSSLESSDSLMDSKDDYRNLAVLASGKRVLPTTQQEVIPDPEQFWILLAEREKAAAQQSRLKKREGSDTFLILDTSTSMQGQPFTDMINTAKTLIGGICDNTEITQENLCIVEVGKKTRVLVHKTCDRDVLLSAIGELRPGGMSPITGAFLITQELLIKKNSNIIVISDGKMTPIHVKNGQDLPDIDDQQLKIQLTILSHNLLQTNTKVFFVPVGPYDSSLMECLVKETGGDEVQPANIHRLYNWTRNTLITLKIADDCRKQHPGVSIDNEQFRHVLEKIGLQSSTALKPDEIDDMMKVAIGNEQSSCSYIECDPNMPPLGTRVRRGPDWKWSNQDVEMPGTIVSHTKNGHIWVEWDYGNIFRYRYGAGNCYDVVTTDSPRVLEGQVIAVGCLVKRGNGWKSGNSEDGRKTGSVFNVSDDGTVQVRWCNGNLGSYHFSSDGHSEVEMCDPSEQDEIEHVFATGGHFHNDEITLEKGDDIDPIVAEMNRKNALKSQSKSKSDNQQGKKVPVTKETDQSKEIGSSESNINEQSDVMKKQTKDKSSPTSQKDEESHNGDNILKLRRQTENRSDASQLGESESPVRDQHISRYKLVVDHEENTENRETPEVIVDSQGNGIWQYKDGYGGWKSYDKEHSEKLEKGYCHHPKGASLLQIGKSSYRISFSKFKQVNQKTKEMVDIRRILPKT